MSTAIRSELRPLIAAAQQAIRECEKDPDAGALGRVRDRLKALPDVVWKGGAFDDLYKADRLLSAAITCAETSSVIDVNYELGVMLNEQPEQTPEEEPTLAAVIVLTGQCYDRFRRLGRADVDKAAWERAYRRGVAAISVLMKELPTFPDDWDAGTTHRVQYAVEAFVTAVHRAVAYRAMYAAREALVEVAESALLFPIGCRQPVRGMEGNGWSRRIGGALYLFTVYGSRPLEKAPAGMITATRVDLETCQQTELHVLPRDPQARHRAEEDAALERI